MRALCWFASWITLLVLLDCTEGQWGSAGRGPGLEHSLITSGPSLEPRERWKESCPLFPSVSCCTGSSTPNNAKLQAGRDDGTSVILHWRGGRRKITINSRSQVYSVLKAGWCCLYKTVSKNTNLQKKPKPTNQRQEDMPTKPSHSYLNGNAMGAMMNFYTRLL